MLPTTLPRSLRTALAAIAASLLLVAVASPASAHSDEGVMTVTTAEADGADQVVLQVGIVYENDGHLATEATVSATGTNATGATVGPVDLPSQADPAQPDEASALYGATVTVSEPGSWTFEITSQDPAATVSTTVEVDSTAPVTEEPIAPAPDDTDEADETEGEPVLVAAPDDADDDDDGSTGALIAGGIALVVVVAAVAVILVRRRSTTS